MEKQAKQKSVPPAVATEAVPPVQAHDLSVEIERAVAREPLDRVHCVRVFEDFYRCNWWAPAVGDAHRDRAAWVEVASNRVRKSSFLCAVHRAGQLVIEEIGREGDRVALPVYDREDRDPRLPLQDATTTQTEG